MTAWTRGLQGVHTIRGTEELHFPRDIICEFKPTRSALLSEICRAPTNMAESYRMRKQLDHDAGDDRVRRLRTALPAVVVAPC